MISLYIQYIVCQAKNKKIFFNMIFFVLVIAAKRFVLNAKRFGKKEKA